MNNVKSLIIASTALCLIGCASPARVGLLEPVGPAPAGHDGAPPDGSLQVYSARQRANVDINELEFRYNNDFGRNDFLYRPAHTDYTIYSSTGKLVEHVRNAQNRNDPQPALVTLPAGRYTIAARAEINGSRMPVEVPVVIEPGRCTQAHLQGNWKPHHPFNNAQVVRLPDGQIAGWRASVTEHLSAGHSAPAEAFSTSARSRS